MSDFEIVQKEHLAELQRYDEERDTFRNEKRRLTEENDQLTYSTDRLNTELSQFQKVVQDKEKQSQQQRSQVLAFKNYITNLLMKETDEFLIHLPGEKNEPEEEGEDEAVLYMSENEE